MTTYAIGKLGPVVSTRLCGLIEDEFGITNIRPVDVSTFIRYFTMERLINLEKTDQAFFLKCLSLMRGDTDA